MTFPSGLRALNHRDYRIFFGGQAVALVGSWMQQVAQAWLVLSLTNSPLRLGLVGSLSFAPVLLFAIVGGAVADRLPKRRLLVATQSVLAAQTLTLTVLVWTGHVRYWHVCVLAIVWGIANTIDLPTRQSFVVELVGRADVPNAVALPSAACSSPAPVWRRPTSSTGSRSSSSSRPCCWSARGGRRCRGRPPASPPRSARGSRTRSARRASCSCSPCCS